MRCDWVGGEVFGGCGEELRVFLGWELEQNWGLLCLCMQPCVAFCLQEKASFAQFDHFRVIECSE